MSSKAFGAFGALALKGAAANAAEARVRPRPAYGHGPAAAKARRRPAAYWRCDSTSCGNDVQLQKYSCRNAMQLQK